MTFTDAGAYIGDSIQQVEHVFGERIVQVYAFESNDDNFCTLSLLPKENITLIKKALLDCNGQASFTSKGSFFRSFDANKESSEQWAVSTETVSLDTMDLEIRGKCILRLDIEGTEFLALKGAERFIRRYKPYIAVCVYHRPEDIFACTSYLHKLVPEYRFFLRGGMHTVCYAFPRSIGYEKQMFEGSQMKK